MTEPTPLTMRSIAELRTAFAEALPGHLARMRAALQGGDLGALQASAHTLAGSAASFDCRRVGNAAAELERRCDAGDLAGSGAAFEALCGAARADAPQVFGSGAEAGAADPPDAAPLILLVDDDQLLAAALARALRDDGFRVRTADGAGAALALLQAEGPRPALAVLDIAMPGMDGLELAQRMEDVPCMFLSASSGAGIASQAAQAGAVGFLLKPIDPPQLLPAVRAALARATDLQELRAAEQRLHQALREGRETGMAVGLLMERYRLDRHAALRMLRNHARSSQRKLNEVASELLQAAEVLNGIAPPRLEPAPARAGAQPERRK